MKSQAITTGCLWLAVGIAAAQSQPPGPSFEVASIKPAEPITPEGFRSGRVRLGMKMDGAQVDFGGLPLADLLRQAFGVKPYQIAGPDWIQSERFDIAAKLPDGATEDQIPAMLQTLLVERFKLAFHREDREHPVYALIAAKGGPKLKESAPDTAPAPPPPPDSAAARSLSIPDGLGGGQVTIAPAGQGRGAVVTGPKIGTMRVSPGQDGAMHMEASKITMAAFSDMLSSFVDRPVVDQTGLKGTYEVTLELSIGDLMNAARSRGLPIGPGMPAQGGFPALSQGPGISSPIATADAPTGTVFAALQKLGLKLDPRKLPVETIVVDHLEKTPTDN